MKPIKPINLAAERERRAIEEAAHSPRVGLVAAWHSFERTRWHRLKPTSRKDYLTVRRSALAYLPAEPSSEDVERWLAFLAQKKAPATVDKFRRILSSVAQRHFLHSGDAALYRACAVADPIKVPVAKKPVVPMAVIHHLTDHVVESDAEKLLVLLLTYHGLRIGEAMGVALSDISADGKRITIRSTRDRYGLRSRKNAKNGKHHIIALGPEVARLVALQCQHTEGSLLFDWHHAYPERLLRRWRKKDPVVREHFAAGGWHLFRHTGATAIAANPNASVTHVQAWLGNASHEAASCYLAQVRGSTEQSDQMIADAFAHLRVGQRALFGVEDPTAGAAAPAVDRSNKVVGELCSNNHVPSSGE